MPAEASRHSSSENSFGLRSSRRPARRATLRFGSRTMSPHSSVGGWAGDDRRPSARTRATELGEVERLGQVVVRPESEALDFVRGRCRRRSASEPWFHSARTPHACRLRLRARRAGLGPARPRRNGCGPDDRAQPFHRVPRPRPSPRDASPGRWSERGPRNPRRRRILMSCPTTSAQMKGPGSYEAVPLPPTMPSLRSQPGVSRRHRAETALHVQRLHLLDEGKPA